MELGISRRMQFSRKINFSHRRNYETGWNRSIHFYVSSTNIFSISFWSTDLTSCVFNDVTTLPKHVLHPKTMSTPNEFSWLDDTNDLTINNLIKIFSSQQNCNTALHLQLLHFAPKIILTIKGSFQLDNINNFNNEIWWYNSIKTLSSRQSCNIVGISIILHFTRKIMFTLDESF